MAWSEVLGTSAKKTTPSSGWGAVLGTNTESAPKPLHADPQVMQAMSVLAPGLLKGPNLTTSKSTQSGPSSAPDIGKMGKELLTTGIKDLLFTPAVRTAQVLGSSGVLGKKIKQGYSQGGDETYLGITVPEQKAFGQGGAGQITGQALDAASWLLPASLLEGAAGAFIRGALSKSITSGALGGLQFGALSGAAEATRRGEDLKGLAKETAIGAGTGAAGGAFLGGVGSVLGRSSRVLEKAKATETTTPSFWAEHLNGTLSERLAATSEKKLPVFSDRTGRPLPVKGSSVETKVPFANDYRTTETIQTRPVKAETPRVESSAPAVTGGRTIVPSPKVSPPVAGELKVAKAASDINRRAVEKGFKSLPPEELAKYTGSTVEKTKADIVAAMEKDFEAIHKAVLSGEGLPAHLRPQPTINAVANRLEQEGRFDEFQRLANSPLFAQRSQVASELGSAAIDSNNPLKTIAHIQKLREGQVANVNKVKVTRNIERGLRRAAAAPTKSKLAKFIDEITC